jgi:hypothetical protein
MALNFTDVKRFPPFKGGYRTGIIDITLDGSYSSGYDVTATNLKLKRIWALEGAPVVWGSVGSTATAYVAELAKSTDTTWNLNIHTINGSGVIGHASSPGIASVVYRVEYKGS